MKISRTVTGLLAVALMAFMVSDALGQGRRDQGGGPGGRGGPGGGGFQRGPGGPGGGRGGPGGGFQSDPTTTMLGALRIDEVKAEIELMPDQEEAIGKITQRREGDRERVDFRSLGEDEREKLYAKMQKEREERITKMRNQLEEVLLPEQFERLHQIAVQMMGMRALTSDEIAKALKISDDQKKKMSEAQAKVREEMFAKFRAAREGGENVDMREAFGKMQEENEKATMSVLTSTQKKEFEEMKGKKFEMPEGAFGFGRGRGGRGGDGGGGRGGPGGAGRGGPGGGGGGPGGGRRRPPIEE